MTDVRLWPRGILAPLKPNGTWLNLREVDEDETSSSSKRFRSSYTSFYDIVGAEGVVAATAVAAVVEWR